MITNHINKLSESVKVLNNMERPGVSKHRILLVGDSHIRSYASALKPLLNNNYDLYGVVKPGSGTSELSESAKKVANQLTHNDVIVICSGSNDYDQNDFSRTFLNIKDYVMHNNHTNIVVMNVPFRYDLPNSSAVNEKISFFNKKLQKLTKVYLHTSFLGIMNNRELFTNHGLHRNKLGKKLVNLQLASLLLTTLNQKTSNPISLGWHEKCVEANQPEGINQRNTCNRNSTRNRKMPVTRSMDFLWLI